MKGKDTRSYIYKLKDPYMDKNLYVDPTTCPTCGLLYHKKRWINNPELLKELKGNHKEIQQKECPACRKIRDKYPLGIVEIFGDFVEQKNEEIHSRIKHIAAEEFTHNPLERIMIVKNEKNRIIIETTTEHLAEKIGKKIAKTFNKKVKISFSDTEKFVRVFVSD
ncbi:MAG: BCAM0308 family protein [candidate division WOR-3 bacterium]